MKGLWLSHESSRDLRLVFCESAIEYLSHTLLPDIVTRYARIGDKTSPAQPKLITSAIALNPQVGSRDAKPELAPHRV